MATICAEMSMSLDGFVADPDDNVAEVFGWYSGGPVTVPTADPRWTFHTSAASAAHLRAGFDQVGAVVTGRRLFDYARAWGGNHPTGAPVFVVTHTVPDGWPRPDAPFTFVTDGLEPAIAQAAAAAGDRLVAVASADIAQQCLDAGLLDEVVVNLVPVLLGRGIRFFDNLHGTPFRLAGPRVVEGTGVTHLRYRVTPEPLALLSRALDQAGRLIDRIGSEQADLPTPCRSWDLRALVNHLVDEVHQFAVLTGGGERDHRGGDIIGTDWPAAYRAAAEELRTAWDKPDALDRTHRLPFGEVPASWALGQHVTEVVAHSWDIARATGQPTDLDPVLGRHALTWARQNLVPEVRGDEADGFQIGPAVAVTDDAPLYDRLAAFGGRTPN